MNSNRCTAEIDARPRQHRRRARLFVAIGVALAALGCRAEDTSPPEVVLEYRIEARDGSLEFVSGHAVHPVAWNLSGDERPAIFQHPPGVVAIRESPGGRACTLRFAVGLQPEAWDASDGVRFRVSIEADGATTRVFETLLSPSQHDAPRWLDHEVELPAAAGRILLETDPGPGADANHDWAGWARPRLVCRTPILPAPPPPSPHVVLISLDTLRADRLGVYGYEASTSPNLDAFARESLVFENAFAVAPFTLPTHASMFTGLYPHEHGAGHASPFVPLGDEPPTLAEHLRDAGYRTLAFTAGGIMSRKNGLARGFDRWFEQTRIPFAEALPRIFSGLGTDSATPTFLFVHTYDIHGPYPDPPPRDARAKQAATEASDADWERALSLGLHAYLDLDRYSSLEEVRAAYDEGIRRVDAQLGALFAHLERLGIWEHALVVVTSDHGETLYDRSLYIGHSYTLHDEIVRVPLILKLPGATRTGRTGDLVEQTDLLPTVLAVLGLPPAPEISGRDVLAASSVGAPGRELVRGEAAHTGSRYVRTRDWKAISAARPLDDAGSRLPAGLADRFPLTPQLYELRQDRGERRNLASTEHASDPEASRLLRSAALAPAPGGLPIGRPGSGPADEELAEQLRALGYVE